MSLNQVRLSLSNALKYEDDKNYVEAFAQYLCCIDLITSQLRQLTTGDKSEKGTSWSVDLGSQQLFFFARECLYRSELILKNRKSYFGGIDDSNDERGTNEEDSTIYPSLGTPVESSTKKIGSGGGLILGNQEFGLHSSSSFSDSNSSRIKIFTKNGSSFFTNNSTSTPPTSSNTSSSSSLTVTNSSSYILDRSPRGDRTSLTKPLPPTNVSVNNTPSTNENSTRKRTPPPFKRKSLSEVPSLSLQRESPERPKPKVPPKIVSKDNLQDEKRLCKTVEDEKSAKPSGSVKHLSALFEQAMNNTTPEKPVQKELKSQTPTSQQKSSPNSNDPYNLSIKSTPVIPPLNFPPQPIQPVNQSMDSAKGTPKFEEKKNLQRSQSEFQVTQKKSKRKSLSQRMISNIQKRELTNKLSDEEHKYFNAVFGYIDGQTKDNVLDIHEFVKHLSLVAFDKEFLFDFSAPYPTVKKSKILNSFGGRIFNAFDSNRSGLIEMSDFKENLALLYSNNIVDEQILFGFNIMDKEGNGSVTRQEFKLLFQQIFSILEYMGLYVSNSALSPTSPSNFVLIGTSETLNYAGSVADRIFSCITNNDSFTAQDYLKAIKQNPFLILGFSQFPIDSNLQSKLMKNLPRNGGYPVLFGHPSFHKVLSMMLGIRAAQENRSNFSNDYLYMRDFKYTYSFEIPLAKFLTCIKQDGVSGNDESTRYIDEHITFTDFAPLVFRNIRAIFGVSEEEYALSFGPEMFISNLLVGRLTSLSERLTDGKSGNFFFYTNNGRFLCKTISTSEFETALVFLSQYYTYLHRNRNTLLTRIYGLHRINDTYFIVMGNAFDTQLPIDKIYDLKGSTIGRFNSSGVGILKDLNWKDSEQSLNLGSKKEWFLRQVESDTKFLEANEIIDYSMLVGVHEINKLREKPINYNDPFHISPPPRTFYQEECGGMRSSLGDEYYFVGIIDILIQYGLKKRGENLIKTLYFGGESGVSVVDPNMYAGRFFNFIKSITD
ncbi:phosphatidylinositol-4-phosphate 5-kinase [Naegleria gruberi]|uniref:Phosphatidylinositol-4-phosphate 5-kinase n=1 Tax=Naegleria gruberi TaxID=5762 RepID=D2UXJ1_NAEGR|nr:phosphatidylinositol-4-phosphate 5-kinase [Naegleria gruberi]EFC50642.1 phosphatidylinositol-4-phosphate 5-kinase [Naegleria gruberi]|eukprot:XP_002683386.1 phosphatidylinositol-4-phosphate 5-kinase [Naegleria gruberi strain NEG-M]